MRDPRDARLKALYAAGTAGEALRSHPEPEAIATAVERRGAEAERLRTIEHIAVCRRCRQEFELLRSAHVAGRQLVARTWQLRAVGLAAAAVLVVAVTLSVGRLSANRSVARSVDRGPVPAGGRGTIALVDPARDASTSTAPLLRWRAARGAASYHVEVLDGDGAVIASRDTPDTSFVAPTLVPGRNYRWWVQATVNGERWRSPFWAFNTRP
jgi:hypothetical protein